MERASKSYYTIADLSHFVVDMHTNVTTITTTIASLNPNGDNLDDFDKIDVIKFLHLLESTLVLTLPSRCLY
jgi:hypothetical protein